MVSEASSPMVGALGRKTLAEAERYTREADQQREAREMPAGERTWGPQAETSKPGRAPRGDRTRPVDGPDGAP